MVKTIVARFGTITFCHMNYFFDHLSLAYLGHCSAAPQACPCGAPPQGPTGEQHEAAVDERSETKEARACAPSVGLRCVARPERRVGERGVCERFGAST